MMNTMLKCPKCASTRKYREGQQKANCSVCKAQIKVCPSNIIEVKKEVPKGTKKVLKSTKKVPKSTKKRQYGNGEIFHLHIQLPQDLKKALDEYQKIKMYERRKAVIKLLRFALKIKNEEMIEKNE